MGRPAYKGASFDPDAAEKAPVPPKVFKSLKLTCPVCGVQIINQRYAFFPSTLYIEGHCVRCDAPRSAFFAPEVEEVPVLEPVPAEADAIVDDFLVFLAGQEEASTPRRALRVISGTDIDDKPNVTGNRAVEGDEVTSDVAQ